MCLCVNDIGVGGVYLCFKIIIGRGYKLVGICDFVYVGCLVGVIKVEVILCVVVNVVEWFSVVGRNFVELCYW